MSTDMFFESVPDEFVDVKLDKWSFNPAHDTHPIWSPDGQQIAFASSRQGSMDIYIVSKDGGIPKRLTTHSGNETPVT